MGCSAEDRIRIRKILHNLETNTNVMDSLVEVKSLKLQDDVVVLVLQKIHNLLHSSYDVSYVRTILDIVHTERACDALFRMFFSFDDRKDFADVIRGLKEKNKMILFKYLRELKDNPLLLDLAEEMEAEFYNVLNLVC